MAESTLSHLNYGHAGAAVYDLDTKDWSFSRQFTAPKLKQVGINDQTSTETIPAAIKFPNTAVTTRRTDAYNNVQALGRIHPHLVPAADLLPELAVISAAIVSTTSAYDPLVGDLYSTGSITSRTRSARWDNPQRVAATVTGEAANVLCISFLCKEYMGWSSDKSVRLRSHTLRNAESGYWNEEAAPIQQVCFAQSEERSALLAVRLPTKTVIFRPFYSQHTQRTPQSNYYNLPPSFLNAHPILRLEADQTGGSAHADVTFNPDFQLQFAVVNQNQVWSVWDIEHGRKGDKYKLSCSVQGSVSSAEEAELIGDDGWARILWVGDVNTIMVCNRRQLSIVGITAGSFAYLPCPRLFTQRSDDWILDVKIHPLLRNHFFILTSACLFLMGVTTSTQALDATAGAEGAKVILSWQHYRGSEDFTLSFSVEVLDQENLCVMLYSRLNSLTQMYTFRNSSSSSALHTASSGPTLLKFATDGASRILQLNMEPCPNDGDVSRSLPSLGRSYFERGLRFYKLFMLQSDLSVHEIILYTGLSEGSHLTEQRDAVKDIFWTTAYPRRRRVRTLGGIREMDDFLEPAGIEVLQRPTSKLPLQGTPRAQRKTINKTHRLVDQTLIYDLLTRMEFEQDASSTAVNIPIVVTQLKQLLAGQPDPAQLPLGTLLEFAGMKIEVSDVDEASSSLRNLLYTDNESDTISTRHIASASLLHLGEEEHLTISALYDSILQNWIAPLPLDVPLRVRQRKERLARRIAAEVMLACARIHQSRAGREFQLGPNQETTISMPILPSHPLRSSPGKSSQWASSQLQSSPPLPLSSISEPQSSPQSFPLKGSVPANPLVRLRKHLKFKEDSELHASIPANVGQLLSQWQPSTDPHDYDWEQAERASRTETVDEASQKQSEKARKRKERREKRQQREDELMRAQPSSQPFTFVKPTSFPRSSPGPMLGGIGGSSQTSGQPARHVPLPGAGIQSSQGGFNSFVAQSQVEPGKYGGRPDKKKKKKGRISGF